MNTKVLTTSIKKELWEFSNILKWLPIIIAALVIVMPLAIFMQSNESLSELFQFLTTFPEQFFSAEHAPMIPKLFFVMALSLFAPFLVVALIIQLYYFTVCLFDERRDLSIMFWRSLPVSDVTAIIAKLITGALAIPAIFLGAATATLCLILLLAFLVCIILSVGYDVSLWALWVDADILSGVSLIWLHLLPLAIWMLPLFAWLMLASMYAKKAPFLWAILPVAVVLLVEGFVVHYFHLSQSYIGSLLLEYFSLSSQFIESVQGQEHFARTVPLQAFITKLNIGSVLVGISLLYGTYWLRKNKAEV
ncbi:MAG: ABC-2 type transport system permease protein [Colwellia sp.]|jgi:ABC-2 type transport system permease protein|uniref:ABC transporter permease n=1 Tax=unclassified Colwellia TaxID=196834 RepID=UPI0015F6C76F|nr:MULTISPECIES: ABC transporter permease [unclassified Colwellia]MBA6251505.1 ABC transporter permease [Colwellia sp. MB3u-55]MBA6397962.1 ABC transporter permease [Colwellia sp. BRX10-4]